MFQRPTPVTSAPRPPLPDAVPETGLDRTDALDPEAGMTTAEYAVGTLAACAFAGVLFSVVRSDAVRGLIASTITNALSLVS